MHIMQALARSCSGACFLGPVRELTAGDTLETVAPPSTAMLAPGAPRSEHHPERAVLADTIAMHRLTGTFTDQRRGLPLESDDDRSVIRRSLQRFQSRGLRSIALYLLVSAHSSEVEFDKNSRPKKTSTALSFVTIHLR